MSFTNEEISLIVYSYLLRLTNYRYITMVKLLFFVIHRKKFGYIFASETEM